MSFDNLNIADIQRTIHYNNDVVGQLFARYLGMNSNDPIGKAIWTDERVQHEYQGTIVPNSLASPDVQWTDGNSLNSSQITPLQQQITYTDEEANRVTQVTPLNQSITYNDNEVNRISQVTPLQQQVTYTDEQTQNQFQGSQQLNSLSGKITDEVVISRFENSGVVSNTYNYAKPKGTSWIESIDYYNDLLQRKLVNNSGGQKLALFLGMYEVLLMMNPRFNYIVNPGVVPSWIPPEGIAPVTLDAIIYDYSRGLLATDVPGIADSDNTSVKDAADSGYALGQITGADFQRPTSPVNRILNIIPNLLRGAIGDGASNDPNIKSLVSRLSEFNKLKPKVVTSGDAMTPEQYKQKYDTTYQMPQLSPKGDVIPTDPIAKAVSPYVMENNNDATKHLNSYYNPDDLISNYGSKLSDQAWLTFNIKPNSKTFNTTKMMKGLDMGDMQENTIDDRFDELVYRELSQFVNTSGTESTTGSTTSTTGDGDKNSFSNILTTGPAADVIKKIYDDMQFPFFFEEVTDQNPTWCGFPATVKLQTDTVSPTFNDTPAFFGRPEQATIYSNTKRSIQIEFQLYVEHPRFLNAYKQRINWLVQRCYPKFYNLGIDVGPTVTIYKSPPLIRMTIGDIYYRLGGYISSLTLNWSSASDIWEKHLIGNRIPLTCNVGLSFNVLHDFIPDATSKFFNWK